MKKSTLKAAAKAVQFGTAHDDEIRNAIRALEKKGRLTPEDVVTEAHNPASPLHDQFEWDDSAAAHQHRLQQARGLIRSVMVNITTEEKTFSTVHYVRDPAAADDQGYVSVEKLRSEPENAVAMLTQAFSMAKTYLVRAEQLADAVGQREAVTGILRALQSVLDDLPVKAKAA